MVDYSSKQVSDGFFAHETAVIDINSNIGSRTKIWHFSHIMSNAIIGENCNLGQNVMIGPTFLGVTIVRFKIM